MRTTLYDPEQRAIYADMKVVSASGMLAVRRGYNRPPRRPPCAQAGGKLVAPEASAEKLVQLLAADKYASGSHVDYFDDTAALLA